MPTIRYATLGDDIIMIVLRTLRNLHEKQLLCKDGTIEGEHLQCILQEANILKDVKGTQEAMEDVRGAVSGGEGDDGGHQH